ncbi:MAG: DNA primase small subunit domain-containing protein [Desulfurococcaceae archaeon]
MAKYYERRPLEEPFAIHQREIAVVDARSKKYIRHLGFSSMVQLYSFIVEHVPLHLHYSSALYEDPDAEDMERKGWLGSELMIDLDVDKYPGCDDVVTVCVSSNVQYRGRGAPCPNNEEAVELPQIDEECLQRAMDDAKRVKRVLEDELGLKEVRVLFSGSRGFHIVSSDPRVIKLGRDERAQIATLISCSDLDERRTFPSFGRFIYFTHSESGIRRRVFEAAKDLGLLERVSNFYRMPADKLADLLSSVCINVDKPVTMDISRLLRFVGSINGKSGLMVREVDMDVYERFDFDDFRPFEGEAIVQSFVDLPSVRVYGKKVELRKGLRERVDAQTAVALALKGLVKLIDASKVEMKSVKPGDKVR